MESIEIAKHPFVVATVVDPQLKTMADFPPEIRQAAYDYVRELALSAAQQLAIAKAAADTAAAATTAAVPAQPSEIDDQDQAGPSTSVNRQPTVSAAKPLSVSTRHAKQ